jgi:hypothetical protein
MSNDLPAADYPQSLSRAVVQTAESLIAGAVGPVEAARAFMGIAAELGTLNDPDFAFFVQVDSASDQFPLGEGRDAWNATALQREDRARQEYEALVRGDALSHCRALVEKYSQS